MGQEQESGVGGSLAGGGVGRRGRLRRTATGVALAAAMATGGLAVAAVNPLGSVGAETTTTVAGQASGPGDAPDAARHDAGRTPKVVTEALASLVADGTLTQEQADAVEARLRDTAKLVHGERKERRAERREAMTATAAEALGISADELVAQLRSGTTIAEIAQERGIDVATVTDALVAQAKEAIDAAVSEDRIDADRADEALQRATERIERFVEDGPRHPRGEG